MNGVVVLHEIPPEDPPQLKHSGRECRKDHPVSDLPRNRRPETPKRVKRYVATKDAERREIESTEQSVDRTVENERVGFRDIRPRDPPSPRWEILQREIGQRIVPIKYGPGSKLGIVGRQKAR